MAIAAKDAWLENVGEVVVLETSIREKDDGMIIEKIDVGDRLAELLPEDTGPGRRRSWGPRY